MARKSPISNDHLYEVAVYLARPEVETEIHAELPHEHRTRFVSRHKSTTQGYPLPRRSDGEPFYVWPPDSNKYGMELRIYFKKSPPIPPIIKSLYSTSKWFARRESFRINYTELVFQLFECGFILGQNSRNQRRIDTFMKKRFPWK